jgi:hypothetical protein
VLSLNSSFFAAASVGLKILASSSIPEGLKVAQSRHTCCSQSETGHFKRKLQMSANGVLRGWSVGFDFSVLSS